MKYWDEKESLIDLLWHKTIYISDSSRVTHEVVYWGDLKEAIERFYRSLEDGELLTERKEE